MSNESVLLCSFIRNSAIDLAKSISRIKSTFDLDLSSIFILEDESDDSKIILTYNVPRKNDTDFNEAIRDTIQVHRKKMTNTLYTLNALNQAIIKENDRLDSNYKIDWNQYQNSLLILRNGQLSIIPTKLKSVIDLN